MADGLTYRLTGLRRRREFVAATNGGHKEVRHGVVVQGLSPTGRESLARKEAARDMARRKMLPRRKKQPKMKQPDEDKKMDIRFGLTVSKKVGNAVTRNRVRRRLRALAQAVLPRAGKAGYDYVLIGRVASINRPFDALKKDFNSALRAIHRTEGENEIKNKSENAKEKETGRAE